MPQLWKVQWIKRLIIHQNYHLIILFIFLFLLKNVLYASFRSDFAMAKWLNKVISDEVYKILQIS